MRSRRQGCSLAAGNQIINNVEKKPIHDKCDYLFCHHPANPEKNTCLFVELKGNDIVAIVSTGYPANDATYRRVMEITKRFQQYHLRIERKTFEMRYQPETDRCLGKGEK